MAAAVLAPGLPIVVHQALAPHTTLGVGGAAAYWAEPKTIAELQAVLAWARGRKLAVLALGGGSNVVVADAGFDGLVLRQARPWAPAHSDAAAARQLLTAALAAAPENDAVWVRVPAAMPWDTFCRQSAALDLWGLEALVGIPGCLGAAPLQNVGAYGQELGQVLTQVEVVDCQSGAPRTLAAAELGLGYRTSHLKQAWRGRYIVVALHLRLARRRPAGGLRHGQLQAALADAGPTPTPAQVAHAVLALRRSKSMVVDAADPFSRSVGSFFVNPVLPPAQVTALGARLPPEVGFAVAGGRKVSAAWLIERAGLLRGHIFATEPAGRVGLSPRHALAIVNLGGARAAHVLAAAKTVRAAVLQAFGVALEAEPAFVGFAELHPERAP